MIKVPDPGEHSAGTLRAVLSDLRWFGQLFGL